jgi:hypothetical protein
VATDHHRNLHALARDLFPDVGHLARFDVLVDLIIAAFQGAALGNLAARRDERSAMVTLATELAMSVIGVSTAALEGGAKT